MKKHIFFVKLRYLIYSPYVWLKLYFNGVQFQFSKCFFAGDIKLVKHTNSYISIGKNSRFLSNSTSNLIGINHKCIISTQQVGASIKIGENCGFSGTTIGCFKSINIGNNVKCGANAVITDADWHIDDNRSGEPKEVTIGNNVWLGYGSIVLKGVNIGDNAVIGAGSIVTKDIPSNVIAAGNPCRVIKSLKC